MAKLKLCAPEYKRKKGVSVSFVQPPYSTHQNRWRSGVKDPRSVNRTLWEPRELVTVAHPGYYVEEPQAEMHTLQYGSRFPCISPNTTRYETRSSGSGNSTPQTARSMVSLSNRYSTTDRETPYYPHAVVGKRAPAELC